MATTKATMQFLMEQLSGVEGVRCRPMMGEYLLYVRDKLVGGVYDGRLLVKDVPQARAFLPDGREVLPYEGAKPMLLVEEVDEPEVLARLLEALYAALPAPRPKRSAKR